MMYRNKLTRRLARGHDLLSAACRVMLLLLLLTSSCRDGLTDPSHQPSLAPALAGSLQPNLVPAIAGWVSVILTTPHHDDGVVQLSLSGAPIDSLQLTGDAGFASLVDGVGKLLVTGDIQSGLVARLWVPDIHAAHRYFGSVEAAATKSTYQLQDVSQGYSVRVIR